MKTLSLFPFLFIYAAGLFGQVLNTSNPQVRAALADGQVEGSPLANFFQKRTPMMDVLFPLIKDEDGIERKFVGAEIGSAYVNESFEAGKVFYNEEELGDVYYRLNAYNNEIELRKTKLDEEKQLALRANEEIKIVTPDKELVYRTFTTLRKKNEKGYLSVIQKGDKYSLYKRIYKKFTEPKPAANSMVTPTPSKFTDYIFYYYDTGSDSSILALPTKTSKFLKSFNYDNTTKLKEFIKSNKLDLNNENHLKKLFSHLNS